MKIFFILVCISDFSLVFILINLVIFVDILTSGQCFKHKYIFSNDFINCIRFNVSFFLYSLLENGYYDVEKNSSCQDSKGCTNSNYNSCTLRVKKIICHIVVYNFADLCQKADISDSPYGCSWSNSPRNVQPLTSEM